MNYPTPTPTRNTNDQFRKLFLDMAYAPSSKSKPKAESAGCPSEVSSDEPFDEIVFHRVDNRGTNYPDVR